ALWDGYAEAAINDDVDLAALIRSYPEDEQLDAVYRTLINNAQLTTAFTDLHSLIATSSA
ncbi:hypothetical protein EJ02DRAFT_512558, partial [Clathrospora elynae]